MKTIKAPALRKGDTVGIIGPAGVVDSTALKKGAEYLRELGFRVRIAPHVLSRNKFFAGSHHSRLMDLNQMIRDPGIRAIFCSRGGYGSVHLIQQLDYQVLRQDPKIFMGASDVTVLLNEIYRRTGLICFHGPMVAANFSKGEERVDLESLSHAIMAESGEASKGPWEIALKSQNVLQKGRAQGRLMGGCLSLLVSTLGTPYEVQFQDAILFLEDVNEPPYRIDRMLKQLADAGKLDSVKGILFGVMLNCSDRSHRQWTVRTVVRDYFRDFCGPVAMGLSSGHTPHPFVTIPIGARVTMDTRSVPKLIVEESTTRIKP